MTAGMWVMYELKWKTLWASIFRLICPSEPHAWYVKYLMVILWELVTSFTHFPPLILSCWLLSPAVLTSTHTECVTDEWWRRRWSGSHIRQAQTVGVNRAVSSHLNCVFPCPFILHTLSVVSIFWPQPRGGGVVWVLCRLFLEYMDACKSAATLQVPRGLHEKGWASMQDGGIERLRETGGRGRGREKEPAQLLNLERMKRALAGVLRD